MHLSISSDYTGALNLLNIELHKGVAIVVLVLTMVSVCLPSAYPHSYQLFSFWGVLAKHLNTFTRPNLKVLLDEAGRVAIVAL